MSNVNHPNHYGGNTPYETIKVLRAWDLKMAKGFCWGNVMKYLSRAGKKEVELHDLEKAAWYANELVAIQAEIEVQKEEKQCPEDVNPGYDIVWTGEKTYELVPKGSAKSERPEGIYIDGPSHLHKFERPENTAYGETGWDEEVTYEDDGHEIHYSKFRDQHHTFATHDRPLIQDEEPKFRRYNPSEGKYEDDPR